jgi:uncharacterized membrane protein
MEELIHLLGPLHPPVVHFPVVCPILAVLALLAGSSNKKSSFFKEAAAWLWILTFLSGFAGVMTGHLFALHLGMESQFSILPAAGLLQGQLREHVLFGSAAFLLSFLGLGAALGTLRQKPWPQPLQWALGIGLAVLFGMTGHEGGEMVFNPPEKTVSAAAPSSGDFLAQASFYRQTLVKMNSKSWNSRTHGHRWVNTYVSKEAVAAYKNSNPLPQGAWVVKESFEDQKGDPSTIKGPLYVMRKGFESESPESGGWQYGLQWDHPVPGNPEDITFPVRWLPGNPRLSSCVKCHNHFKSSDYMGGIPEGFENP